MIYFVIPAYNEEENVEILLGNLRSALPEGAFEVIVIDDGSTDGTADRVRASHGSTPLHLIRFEHNRGVGPAFRAGFARALELGKPGDVVVTKESDNTSDLGILPAMLNLIEHGNDLVLASCYAKGGGIVGTTPLRVFLSGLANLLLTAFFPIRGVYTYSSFYRAYRMDLLQKAHARYGARLMSEDGFVCMVELVVKLAATGARIAEVPVTVRGDLRGGKSKMRVLGTMLGYVRFCLRHRALWRASA